MINVINTPFLFGHNLSIGLRFMSIGTLLLSIVVWFENINYITKTIILLPLIKVSLMWGEGYDYVMVFLMVVRK